MTVNVMGATDRSTDGVQTDRGSSGSDFRAEQRAERRAAPRVVGVLTDIRHSKTHDNEKTHT